MDKKKLAEVQAPLEEVKMKLEEIHLEAQDAYDEKSEKWQESAAGEEAAERIGQLEVIKDAIEGALDEIADLLI